jgi:MFS family permease
MTIVNREEVLLTREVVQVVQTVQPAHPVIHLPRLRWTKILTLSIFWFALNFHWAALGIIILPSQVFKLVGDLHKGEALAFILIPGAFVSLFANPLFGMLSDRMRGRLAALGRRRPYILIGTLLNMGCLVWMALAPNIISLAIAYSLVQLFNNAATAPFHALLPDIVPEEQRGMASGMMGFMATFGSVVGVVFAGIFIDANLPVAAFEHNLWITYGVIIIVMTAMMLFTIFSIRERDALSIRLVEQETQVEQNTPSTNPHVDRTRPTWFAWVTPSLVRNVLGTLSVAVIAWGAMALWNALHIIPIMISSNVQQVVLEVIATVGILRLFDFHPRRNPDFAWVLVTRLVMMLGVYTVQDFLQYYIRDVVHAAHPEAQTTNFIIILSLTSLVSAIFAGWLSDRFGRKRMVYFAGGLMSVVGLVFVVTQSLPIILAAGAIFGLGYGAYISVDWALVADVLPSHKHYARDMGVWNISLSLPQVIAPVIGGPLIDSMTKAGHSTLGFQLLFGMSIVYCLLATITVSFIRGVKH